MATQLRYPGKVVIVTGGTAGIGLAIVREFVHQGANVVFCSRVSGETGLTTVPPIQSSKEKQSSEGHAPILRLRGRAQRTRNVAECQEMMQRQIPGMATQLRYPGKVVIVTGGTAGIGLAIVREFVRQGANVVFCSKASEVDVGRAIQRELQDSGCPGDAYFQVCDVRNEADIKRLIEVTLERYGCLDCLVNNVGSIYLRKIDDETAQDFSDLMELNVVSMLLASKYALPYLWETRGNIINMASLGGIIGMKETVSYSATKGAVIAMTKALAIDESKYGVRVNSISPGCIRTPLMERIMNLSPDPEAEIQKWKNSQLMGRVGAPEEVALAALYLAADGTFCTGSNLLVSGGAEVGFGEKNQVDLEPGPCASGYSQDSSSKQ